MAVRPSLERRGWGYDLPNTRLGAYVDGIEAIRLTKSVTGADLRLLGDTPATYYINWSASTYTLNLRGKLTTGVSGTGYDVQLFGATAGASLLWDASDNALEVVGLASIEVGTTGTPLVLTAGTPIFDMYTTCATVHASTSAESFYVKNTMTGIAGVGGRARFHMYTNVALGSWSNALKAYAEYGAAGRTTGLGSALCAEMLLSAGTTSGTYAPLEGELVADSAVSTGTATSFMYMNIAGSNGTGKTTLNTNGYLFELGAGVVDTSSGMFDVVTKTPTSVEFDANLKIRVGGVDYFIPLSADNAFE